MQDPPCPYFCSSSVITLTAFSAVSALSSPSLWNCRVTDSCFVYGCFSWIYSELTKASERKNYTKLFLAATLPLNFPFAPRDEHSLASGGAVEIQTTLFAGSLPDKIHAQESLLTIRTVSAPHCLISNAHLMLICAHLCPPQPCWFAQHHCICVGDLLNLYVGTLPGQTRDRGKVC